MRVIKDNAIHEDNWVLISELSQEDELPVGNIIIPFDYWKENQAICKQRDDNTAVCINGDNNTAELADYLDQFQLIALEFPAYKDGRCYSHARLLRDRYEYAGDIRAVGDVLRDQLFYMKRCGISSFAIREDKDFEDALKALKDFSVTYQGASDENLPLYKTR
jgi:uncharacterized protein (DUF934 family)